MSVSDLRIALPPMKNSGKQTAAKAPPVTTTEPGAATAKPLPASPPQRKIEAVKPATHDLAPSKRAPAPSAAPAEAAAAPDTADEDDDDLVLLPEDKPESLPARPPLEHRQEKKDESAQPANSDEQVDSLVSELLVNNLPLKSQAAGQRSADADPAATGSGRKEALSAYSALVSTLAAEPEPKPRPEPKPEPLPKPVRRRVAPVNSDDDEDPTFWQRWKKPVPMASTIAASLLVFYFFAPLHLFGNSDHVRVYAAQGSVEIDGEPIPKAAVLLHPVDPKDSKIPKPRATAQPDGTFVLGTYDEEDGAPPGEYKVTVLLFSASEGTHGTRAMNLLPPRYASPDTTDLTVRIEPGENQLPAFKLTAHR
jgi:hypothetical protein